MIRLLYISENPCSHDDRFVKYFKQYGFDVYYLSYKVSDYSLENIDEKKIINIHTSKPSFFSYIHFVLSLASSVKENSIDLIHVGPLHTMCLAVYLARLRNYIAVSWGYDLLLPRVMPFYRLMLKVVLRKSRMVIVDCDFAKQRIQKMGVDKDIFKMPWGLEKPFKSIAKKTKISPKLKWHQGHIVILSNRQWGRLYNVDMIIHAFSKLIKKHPEIRLYLVGSGNQKNKLIYLIEKYNLLSHIMVLGQLNEEELHEVYSCSDIYVSAAEVDGSSISLLEAMAYQLHAIVSDFPSNNEWIAKYDNGELFRNKSLVSLTNVLDQVIISIKEDGKNKSVDTSFLDIHADFKQNMQALCRNYSSLVQEAHG